MDKTTALLRKIARSFGGRENVIAIVLVLSQTVYGQLLDAVKNSLVQAVAAGREGSDLILHIVVLNRPTATNPGMCAYRAVNSDGVGAWQLGTLIDAAASYEIYSMLESAMPDDCIGCDLSDVPPDPASKSIDALNAMEQRLNKDDFAKFFDPDEDQELYF